MKNKIFLFIAVLAFFMQPNFHVLKSKSLQEKKDQNTLQHEVKVSLVLVDVIVTKDETFVTDLKMDEMELYEDGVKVPINSLELISFVERKVVTLKEKPEGEIYPDAPTKKLVVVIDGVNSRSRHLMQGSKKIFSELISLVELGHEVMIVQLNAEKGVEILQPFTTDEELIRGAIEKVAGDIWVDKSRDSLRMAQEMVTKSTGEQAQVQRKLDEYAQVEALLQEYGLSKKQRFEISTGGILAVANMIKNLPGRKSIMLISDGIPSVSRKELGIIKVFDPFNILKRKKFINSDEVLQELIRYANAQNISIYTLDIGTFTKYFFTSSVESDLVVLKSNEQERLDEVQNLGRISEDTGAAWLRGTKKYDRFRKVMETDLNYYYQLSYYPPRKKPDNKYHEIELKVKRPGVNARYRKGYTDYSEEEELKILLGSAFYNPELYRKLPFEAEFIPFFKDTNKYKPWMSIALPVKKLFSERGVTYGSKVFNIHILVEDIKREVSVYWGQMNIPLEIDSSFMELIEATDYFCFHFTGPEVEFDQREYRVIFALYDTQTEEIGTWESSFFLPDFEEERQGAMINCVLGSLASNPEGERKSFSLSDKGGSLECGEMKFFPAVTNRFQEIQDASVFLQVFVPQGKIDISPQFKISGNGRFIQHIAGELVTESWNKESKVWSGIFNLNLENVMFGDYILKAEILLSEEGPVLSKELKLIKLRY
ncbi:MAG: VWA domain-containing protein [Nitrospirota bacterium]|nr:VWA domain-containing protein [Nitrospirota bacterium]MDH5743270.1 VWA domain-containing protein [Candidatus Aminicenantes bacterium]